MSTRVDVTCDRCGKVLPGDADQGAAPHCSLMLDSMSRRVEEGFAFDAISWDLCLPCARAIAADLTGTWLLPVTDTDAAAFRWLTTDQA